jgi:uncharacterized protein
MKKPLRMMFLLFGIVMFGIGAVAAFLPLLPSFPFLLLSVVLISKGSPRITKWIVSTKLYQNNVVAIRDRKAMTRSGKIKLIATLTIVFGTSFALVPLWYVRVLLGMLWTLHVSYFLFRIKTVSKPEGAIVANEEETQ